MRERKRERVPAGRRNAAPGSRSLDSTSVGRWPVSDMLRGLGPLCIRVHRPSPAGAHATHVTPRMQPLPPLIATISPPAGSLTPREIAREIKGSDFFRNSPSCALAYVSPRCRTPFRAMCFRDAALASRRRDCREFHVLTVAWPRSLKYRGIMAS